jgi:hypothetical protein
MNTGYNDKYIEEAVNTKFLEECHLWDVAPRRPHSS